MATVYFINSGSRYVHSLFHDSISSAEFMHNRMCYVVNGKSKGIWKQTVVAYLNYHGIGINRMRKTTKNS
jgi:hypothetical protein